MDALLRKLRATYANAQDALGEWAAAQSTLCALCAASCSVVTRLRLLADDAHFGALKLDGTVPELCRRTQLEALDALLQSAHEQLRTLRAVVQRLEKLAADGNALLQGLRPPPAQGGGVRHGPQPSLAECVEGLDDLWRVHRDELALKEALLLGVTLDASERDLQGVQALLNAEPNVQSQRRDALLLRACA